MSAKNPGAVRAIETEELEEHIAPRTEERIEAPAPVAFESEKLETAQPPEKKKRRIPVLPVILLALAAAGGWYGYNWWIDGRFLVNTDDAYIAGDIAVIAPKVSGYITKVEVTENQHVNAGDPLVRLDEGDYRLAFDQATAQIVTEQLSLNRIDAQILGARAAVQQAQAQKGALEAALRGAEINQKRATQLQSKDVGTAASSDSAQVALEQADANLVAGDANVEAANANVSLLQAQRKEAESAVRSLELSRDKAARDLSFTVLRAPYDGVIGNLAVQTGDLVSIGKRLASLVPLNELYVDANFKETQIGRLVPGSKVRLHVDAYGDDPIEGKVSSIAPASGSVFSMLPAENATGNFTKVVQRVPVRIDIPRQELEKGRLRAGLSVVVDVDTRTAPEPMSVKAELPSRPDNAPN